MYNPNRVWTGRGVGRLVGEGEFATGGVDHDGPLARYALTDDVLAQAVEQHRLDGTFHGPCAEFRVVAGLCQQGDCRVAYLQRHAVACPHAAHTRNLHLHDFTYLLLGERGEHDNLIDSVQELRPDGLLEHFHHLIAGLVDDAIAVGGREVLEAFANQARP